MRTFFLWLGTLGVLVMTMVMGGVAQEYLPDLDVDHPAIDYYGSTVDNRVTRLAIEIENGQVELEVGADGLAFLSSLLGDLGVNRDSQALVFSKTSFQAVNIGPDNPRAIYFSDDVAVAFVRGSDEIEIMAIDPKQGPVFYTANIRNDGPSPFTRETVCLNCHLGPATSGVPGVFIGSVFPGPTGTPSPVDAIITDHRTEFKDRWGGWYINATSGQQEDRSNAVASNPALPLELDIGARQNQTHLYGKVDTDGYLEPLSDIVSLMTFEHQTQMTNYITRVGWEWRILEQEGDRDIMQRAQFDSDVEALVAYMLFADEVPLPEPLEGVSTFTKTFPKRGPHDERGRSLRNFDLETRLFRYPLSYMVYSEAFEALPESVLEKIYSRLYDVLTGTDQEEKFAHLSGDDRRNILEILRETKPSLPAYWKSSARR